MKLSLRNGFVPYWNVYKNTTIDKKPFNVTVINSYVANWEIGVGSAVKEKSSLMLFDSNITVLNLDNVDAIIERSYINSLRIGYLSYPPNSNVSILESTITELNLPSDNSSYTLIQNSTIGISLFFRGVNHIVLSDLQPGYLDYFSLKDHVKGADFNVIIKDSHVNGWAFRAGWNVSIVLNNSYIRRGQIFDEAVVTILSNSTLEDIKLSDNAIVIRQCLFNVKFLNESVVKGAEISVYRDNVLLLKTTSDESGEATVNLIFNAGNWTLYRSTYKSVICLEISNISRGCAITYFNMVERQPILAKLQLIETIIHEIIVDGQKLGVVIESNSTVSNFNYSKEETKITFTVKGSPSTIGFCNVTIPLNLMRGPYTVKVDGAIILEKYEAPNNGTHSFLYFTYTHTTSQRQVEITPVHTTSHQTPTPTPPPTETETATTTPAPTPTPTPTSTPTETATPTPTLTMPATPPPEAETTTATPSPTGTLPSHLAPATYIIGALIAVIVAVSAMFALKKRK